MSPAPPRPKRGRPQKTAQAREQQRERVLAVAVEVIRRVGSEASMDDIAAAAGVSKPVIYDLYGSKTELAMALGVHVFQDALGAVLTTTGSLPERIEAALDGFAAIIERDTAVYRFIVIGSRPSGPSLVDQPLIQLLTPLTKILAGLEGPLADITVVGMLSLIFGALERWSLDEKRIARADFVHHITTMAVAALEAARV
ncbi:TetR/AcrR family transcriptional regulator [Nocardia beijingensis]|uniref:TetR/AcrR family transcriptional regulator n=1 Tax=Nocardia beijingensis TaxID=95162 RepID=UPI00344F8E62